ncbi:DNA (cytosine-5-)-methyltransferase [Ancistrocladus abbreviatus]
MNKITNTSDKENLLDWEAEIGKMPKVEESELDSPPGTMCSMRTSDNVASSSGTNLRSSLIGMGFSPFLVDKVIKEKGEDDVDLLLEALFAYSAPDKSNSESSDSADDLLDGTKENIIPAGFGTETHPRNDFQLSKSPSSDSLDSLFDDDDDVEILPPSVDVHLKEEAIALHESEYDKRASLLRMKFSVNEVDFAIKKLGEGAPIDELVDFIIAAQMAETQDAESPDHGCAENNVDSNTETLFGTMDKTLQLLELGFTEHEVSLAIEKFGSEVPITELADWICRGQLVDSNSGKAKGIDSLFKLEVKLEDPTTDYTSQTRNMSFEDIYGGKKPKEEYHDDSSSFMRDFDLDRIMGKRPKKEYDDVSSTCDVPSWKRSKKGESNLGSCTASYHSRKLPADRVDMPKLSKPNACRSLDAMVAKPPYFLYGNVMNLSNDSWQKMSQFLYAVEPEFVNTQFFSALSRKEGYIHNLPTEGRVHIHPNSPMTIEDAIPHTKKWWPSWDTRKQLGCISSETTGISQICYNLEKILKDARGVLSAEQQTKLLYHCRTLNLVWIGQYKLAPIEPEHLESILGYPVHHTQSPEVSLAERLESLRCCFQTDTLGYHVSVLKSLFPDGLTMLSIYSGIGGAEVTLHRLGLNLKGVVSIEPSEMKRKVLQRWWQNTGQTGELVQIEDVQKLSSSKLEFWTKKFGGFDFIICQNPCTYSSKASKVVGGSSDVAGLDFSLFYEFVRVLQRVRSMAERNS